MDNSVFRSKRQAFSRRHDAFVDMLLGHMSIDIEIGLKTWGGMPVDKGQMKAATRTFRNRLNQHRVEINKEYAAAQEEGVIDGHPIRNYTTSGTSAGFFQRVIDKVWSNRLSYINEAKRALD